MTYIDVYRNITLGCVATGCVVGGVMGGYNMYQETKLHNSLFYCVTHTVSGVIIGITTGAALGVTWPITALVCAARSQATPA
jgi:hypothetical protein